MKESILFHRDDMTLKKLIDIAKDSKTLSSKNFWLGLQFDRNAKQWSWISDGKQAHISSSFWSEEWRKPCRDFELYLAIKSFFSLFEQCSSIVSKSLQVFVLPGPS